MGVYGVSTSVCVLINVLFLWRFRNFLIGHKYFLKTSGHPSRDAIIAQLRTTGFAANFDLLVILGIFMASLLEPSPVSEQIFTWIAMYLAFKTIASLAITVYSGRLKWVFSPILADWPLYLLLAFLTYLKL